jgi:hypothetical protein
VRATAEAGSDHGPHGGHGDVNLPGSEVRVARLNEDGRSFGPGIVAYRDVCPCCRTSIVSDDDGVVFVAFRTARDNLRDVVVTRSTDGGVSFGEVVRVHDDGWLIDACPHAGPSLALDGAGRLHVAWYTGAPERQGLWHAVSDDGGLTFSPPTPILAEGWVPPSQVRLATDNEGSVWAAWDDRREEDRRVYAARLTGQHRQHVMDRPFSGASPAIAAGADIVVAWTTAGGVAEMVWLREASR